MARMSNDKFQDIAILKTLAQLRSRGSLHPDDYEVLRNRLRSDWGRQAAKDMLSGDAQAFAAAESVLKRFSSTT